MEYNTEVFSYLYPQLKNFVFHYYSYKALYEYLDELPGNRELWVYTTDAHLEMATITWCMIFGADSNELHWKKLNLDEKGFRDYLFKEIGVNQRSWDDYWKAFTNFRNEYVAHRKGYYDKPVPVFDIAIKAAILLEKWIREEIKPDFVAGPTIEELSEEYIIDARKTILYLVKKKKCLFSKNSL